MVRTKDSIRTAVEALAAREPAFAGVVEKFACRSRAAAIAGRKRSYEP